MTGHTRAHAAQASTAVSARAETRSVTRPVQTDDCASRGAVELGRQGGNVFLPGRVHRHLALADEQRMQQCLQAGLQPRGAHLRPLQLGLGRLQLLPQPLGFRPRGRQLPPVPFLFARLHPARPPSCGVHLESADRLSRQPGPPQVYAYAHDASADGRAVLLRQCGGPWAETAVRRGTWSGSRRSGLCPGAWS